MALSWRIIGTFDPLVLSWLVITYVDHLFGHEGYKIEALQIATYIAITEVVTKMVLYFLHERGWARIAWGVSAENGKRKESGWRSFGKTATQRIIALLDTTQLEWFSTGSLATAISIGGFGVVNKLILYFLHERAWSRIQYGTRKESEVNGT